MRQVVEIGRSGHVHEWQRRCSTQQTSEGRADGGWGGGRARVASWGAVGPRQLPLPPPPPPSWSSPAAPVFVGKETNGLGRQTCRLRGLGCPPLRCHLDTYVVADGDARVTAWMPRGLSNSPSLFPSIAPSHAGEDPQPFHPSLGWRPGRH
jgi:hypothetical protein